MEGAGEGSESLRLRNEKLRRRSDTCERRGETEGEGAEKVRMHAAKKQTKCTEYITV